MLNNNFFYKHLHSGEVTTLVLSSYIIDECYEVIRRKKPSLIDAPDAFFAALPFELEHPPENLPNHGLFVIRDKNDERLS